jgi:hypothetical protein
MHAQPHGTEEQRDRVPDDTEELTEPSLGGTEATDERDVVPPLAASVGSLPEAVALSLSKGIGEDCLFTYARALLAFQATTSIRLSEQELGNAFSLWWATAKPKLPPDADFDEWRFAFDEARLAAKTPLGCNPLDEAIRRADAMPVPTAARRYSSAKLQRLVAVCSHLQDIVGDAPIFLSVRSAARIIGCPKHQTASSFLNGLVRDGVLLQVEKGTPGGRRATRFRFHRPGTPAVHDLAAPAPPSPSKPAAPSPTPKPERPARITPSQAVYQRAEAIKSLEKLLKEHPGDDPRIELDDPQRADFRAVKRRLAKLIREQGGLP